MQINKSMLRITILLTSMVMMGASFLAPIMGELTALFPQYAPSTIQMLMTVPNLIVVIISLLFGTIEAVFDKKSLCVFATGCVAAAAVGFFFLHSSLPVMFLLSVLLGLGLGIISNITVVMISLYYHGEEEASLMGLQSSFVTIGGVIMNIAGGLLAGIAWYYDCLTPLIAVPAMIMCLLFVPKQKSLRTVQEKVSLPKTIFPYFGIAFLFGSLYNMLPTNMALIVGEKALGGPSFSGLATAVFMSGGILGGFIYAFLQKILSDKVGAVAVLNLGIGMFLLSVSPNSIVFLVGAFWGGCSVSLLMPQFMFSISNKTDKKVTPTALGYLTVSINAGNFLAPQVFARIPAATVSMGLHRASLIALVLGAVFFVLLKGPIKQK